MFHVAGTDGSFLATASPTLRSLHLDRLPDFKARMLLLVTTRSTHTSWAWLRLRIECGKASQAAMQTISNFAVASLVVSL